MEDFEGLRGSDEGGLGWPRFRFGETLVYFILLYCRAACGELETRLFFEQLKTLVFLSLWLFCVLFISRIILILLR